MEKAKLTKEQAEAIYRRSGGCERMSRLEDIKKELELDWSDISYVVNQNDVKWLVNRVGELEQQNKRYREALEWYSENSPHGNIADEALEGEE